MTKEAPKPATYTSAITGVTIKVEIREVRKYPWAVYDVAISTNGVSYPINELKFDDNGQ